MADVDELRNIEQDEEKLMSNSPPSSSENQAETKHEFSSPWQKSDLVLIVEDQKLHVHRLILEMTSPVLCHLFKETDSNEISLLRTNVSYFFDFLRVIYPQFENNITLDNIEHIYRLAEEYQIESVIKVCQKYLVQVKKTTTNAMRILVTAQVCEADEARKQCYEVLKGLTVAKLKTDQFFKHLDNESLRNVLLPKAERLEKCLREIQPQLFGLVDFALFLLFHGENMSPMAASRYRCPVHHSSVRASTAMETRIKCPTCRAMFEHMARNSYQLKKAGRDHNYSVIGKYFDENIVDVIKEIFSLLKM